MRCELPLLLLALALFGPDAVAAEAQKCSEVAQLKIQVATLRKCCADDEVAIRARSMAERFTRKLETVLHHDEGQSGLGIGINQLLAPQGPSGKAEHEALAAYRRFAGAKLGEGGDTTVSAAPDDFKAFMHGYHAALNKCEGKSTKQTAEQDGGADKTKQAEEAKSKGGAHGEEEVTKICLQTKRVREGSARWELCPSPMLYIRWQFTFFFFFFFRGGGGLPLAPTHGEPTK